MRNFYVYILTNQRNSLLYVGLTNDIERRIWEHKNKINSGFTSKYKISKLVHVEIFEEARYAIDREKKLKSWTRLKKISLISEMNPNWNDLHEKWQEIQKN